MAFKQVVQEEHFQKNVEQLRTVEQRAQILEKTPRPLTRDQQQFLDAYSAYRPAVQQLIKIADIASSNQQNIDQMRLELESNKPSRAKEVFSGTVAGAVGALSLVGHPFVQLYEFAKGKEVVTLKDTAEVMGEAGKYLRGEQTQAWQQATVVAIVVDAKLDNFYGAYNKMVNSFISGDPITLGKAKYELASAANELKDASKALSDLGYKYKAELEELSGFFDVSKKFLKDAAIEVAITLASVKALELVGKGAHHFLPKVAEKVGEKLGAITGGVIRAESVMLAGERAVQGVVAAERWGQRALRAKDAYISAREIDHVAHEESDVHIELIAMR